MKEFIQNYREYFATIMEDQEWLNKTDKEVLVFINNCVDNILFPSTKTIQNMELKMLKNAFREANK